MTVFVVRSKTKERMKKIALLKSVHLRPILSANGPAMKGAEIFLYFLIQVDLDVEKNPY